MVMTDPIADFLTRLRNGLMVRKRFVIVPYSKIKVAILKILKDKGLISGFSFKESSNNKKSIVVYLRYDEKGEPFLENLRRVSKPGRRIYLKAKDLKPLRKGYAFRIISTSRGIMTDDESRKRKLGGEVICEIY